MAGTSLAMTRRQRASWKFQSLEVYPNHEISNVLDFIDNGDMALPEFQRGYVWNRDQVRGLFESLYRRHPVGGLLNG